MAVWTILQFVIDLGLLLSSWILWQRLRRPPQDDPRLSRGLQILASKITILEDLSDRTDKQVQQLTELLDQRARTLQTKMFESEKLVRELEQSMQKSREVAEIFQDRIPHEEIIERQNTIKYVQAAQMAHQGRTIDEIAEKVDLPREQIEFIAKINRQQLMFDIDQLPEWAKPIGVIGMNAQFEENSDS
jgi:mannose/fructose/N-acetylgalactosamine-specific phosphotransferase system component IIB